MDAHAIIAALDKPKGLPRQALSAASEQREDLAPVFIAEIEAYIAATPDQRRHADALFFMFHLLGEWRETSAYPTLARFLRLSDVELARVLDDAVTETSHRVMMSVFDGDPQPLYDIILDPEASEFVRSLMLQAATSLVAQGRLDRGAFTAFLQACFTHLEPQGECMVWDGWQNGIALLGIQELTALVAEAFRRGYIDPMFCDFAWYEKTLHKSLETPDVYDWLEDEDYQPFGNAIEEFSKWHGFSEAYRRDLVRAREAAIERYLPRDPRLHDGVGLLPDLNWVDPVYNPHRDVGRNDPCPCGSGTKFKKCCLQ
jgi:Protein of unknown function (DUF1186)/SEC-C motif